MKNKLFFSGWANLARTDGMGWAAHAAHSATDHYKTLDWGAQEATFARPRLIWLIKLDQLGKPVQRRALSADEVLSIPLQVCST